MVAYFLIYNLLTPASFVDFPKDSSLAGIFPFGLARRAGERKLFKLTYKEIEE